MRMEVPFAGSGGATTSSAPAPTVHDREGGSFEEAQSSTGGPSDGPSELLVEPMCSSHCRDMFSQMTRELTRIEDYLTRGSMEVELKELRIRDQTVKIQRLLLALKDRATHPHPRCRLCHPSPSACERCGLLNPPGGMVSGLCQECGLQDPSSPGDGVELIPGADSSGDGSLVVSEEPSWVRGGRSDGGWWVRGHWSLGQWVRGRWVRPRPICRGGRTPANAAPSFPAAV